ncbi:MAG: SH3 domain-containing protein [Treponema sp.]|nr:SH3 domain-containing protein [Treponema sp.]
MKISMKKLISILFTFTSLALSVFADKARFYQAGKVINTMYVDSAEGLRVRDKPSLKSNRLCALTHRLPLKVVAIGREETIDGITAPWVEILIPRYEWKGDNPEYGWVFGGYLSENMPKFIAPKNAEELSDYLTRLLFLIDFEENPESMYAVRMLPDGTYDGGLLNGARPTEGTWKALGKNSFLLSKVYDNGFDSNEKVTVTVKIEGLYTYFSHVGPKFKRIFPSEHISLELYDDNMNSAMLYETNYKNQTYLQYLADCNKVDFERVTMSICAGVSAKGTKYEKQYHDYWAPIMEEHQKKADAIK